MKFFVDTADVAEIKELAAAGLLDGVTTEPSLIMQAGRPMLEAVKEAETVAGLSNCMLIDNGSKAFLDDRQSIL